MQVLSQLSKRTGHTVDATGAQQLVEGDGPVVGAVQQSEDHPRRAEVPGELHGLRCEISERRALRTEQRASLLGARTLLGAPGIATRSKDATSNKDASRLEAIAPVSTLTK